MNRISAAITVAVLVAGAGPLAAQQADPEYTLDGSRVFWFVHLSDTHVDSVFPGNDARMGWAIDEGIPTVGPDFVVVTGDLTDSTNGIIYGFGPYEDEWQKYRDYLDGQSFGADFFFDLPGNHDQYGDGELAFYRDYSLWGSATDGTQPHWRADYEFGSYLFFGLATPGNDGAQWPFDNATLTEAELDELEAALDADGRDADLIFLFGHHDYAEVESADQLLERIAPYGVRLYIHGHEHDHGTRIDTSADIIRYQIASVGQSGSNNFGIWAVDANAVSVGVWNAREAWPAIVVTAPVDARLNDVVNPYATPVPNRCRQAPVRALVFDTEAIESVAFFWDDGEPHEMARAVATPQQWRGLFDATGLEPRNHELTVTATGSETHSVTIQVDVVDAECELGEADPEPADTEPDPGDTEPGADTGADDSGDSGEGDAPADGGPGDPPAVDGLAADVPAADTTVTPAGQSGGAESGCGCAAAGSGGPTSAIVLVVLPALRRRATRGRGGRPQQLITNTEHRTRGAHGSAKNLDAIAHGRIESPLAPEGLGLRHGDS